MLIPHSLPENQLALLTLLRADFYVCTSGPKCAFVVRLRHWKKLYLGLRFASNAKLQSITVDHLADGIIQSEKQQWRISEMQKCAITEMAKRPICNP